MKDEPEIIKELREAEKFGRFQSKIQGAYDELETTEESSEDVPEQSVGFVEKDVERKSRDDVTKSKGLGEITEESKDRYRLIAEYTSDLIALTTFKLNTTFTYVSPSYKKTLGYEPEDLIGKPCFDFIHPDDKKNLLPLLKKYVITKGKKFFTGKSSDVVERVEFRIRDKSGDWHYVESTINIIKDELLVVSKEITERKKAEDALRRARDDLEKRVGERTAELSKSNILLKQEISKRKKMEETLRESEEKFRDLFENANDLIQSVDINGRFVYVNKKWLRTLGYTEDEVKGLTLTDVLRKDQISHCMEIFKEVCSGKSFERIETVFVSKDGGEIYVEGDANARFKDGKFITTRGIFRDITERKKTEEEIRKLSSTVEQSPSEVIITDIKANIEYVNPKFSQTTGYTRMEVIGKTPRILQSGETPPGEYKRLWDTITAGENWQGEFHNRKKNGKLYWENALIAPIKDNTGKITHFLKVAEDITERKKAEEELKESKEKISNILASSPDSITITDLKGNIVNCNQETLKLLGFSSLEEAVGESVFPFITKKDRKRAVESTKKTLEEGITKNIEYNIVNKKEAALVIEVSTSVIKDFHGKLSGFVAITKDITERKKAEEVLQGSEENYRELAESITDVFFAMDRDLRYTYWNKASEELTGIKGEDAVGKSIFEIFLDTEDTRRSVAVYQEALKTRQPQSFVTEYQLGGKDFFFEISAYPSKDGLSVFTKDITERKKVEEKLKIAHGKLERKVNELERYKETTVNRELKMVELKNRIKELEGGVKK